MTDPGLNRLQTPRGPHEDPTSAEVIGFKDARDGVAGCAVTPAPQTLVLLLRRVQVVVTADDLPGGGERRRKRPGGVTVTAGLEPRPPGQSRRRGNHSLARGAESALTLAGS